MLNSDQYKEMADKFIKQNNLPMAIQMYNEILNIDPKDGEVHINVAKIMASQGNIQGEYQALKQFMLSNLTPITLDAVPGAKQRIADIEKQIAQQPK